MAQVHNVYAVTKYDCSKYGVPKVLGLLGKSIQEVVNELCPDTPWLANAKALQGLYRISEEPLYLDKSWKNIPLLLEQLGWKKTDETFKHYIREVENECAWILYADDWGKFLNRICGKISTEREIDAFFEKAKAKIGNDFFIDFGGREYAIYLLGYLRKFLKYGLKWASKKYNLIIV